MSALIWKSTRAGNKYPYVVYQESGRQIWVSLTKYANLGRPFRGRKEADTWFRHWLKFGPRANRQSDDVTVASFLLEYRRQTETTKSRACHRTDTQRLAGWETWLTDRGVRILAEITPRLIDDFKRDMSPGRSATTVNRYLEILRAALNTAVRWGHLEKNPATGIAMLPRRDQRQRRVLTDEEIRLVENEFPEPERTFCLFGLYAGLRAGEIVALEWADVDLRRQTLTVQAKPGWAPKGLLARTIPLAPVLTASLGRMQPRTGTIFSKTDGSPYLCRDAWYKRIVYGLFRQHGITGANLHSMRHTFVTRLLRAHVSLAHAQQLARHRDIKTTLTYVHLVDDDLRAALKRITD
jgi:integrase